MIPVFRTCAGRFPDLTTVLYYTVRHLTVIKICAVFFSEFVGRRACCLYDLVEISGNQEIAMISVHLGPLESQLLDWIAYFRCP
jgi:hypothetical protein